ncbi:hypothetical protein GCM10007377_14780 [Galliscardovia ingluviei]|uniref:Uncharacterized protein n=1 Tax=Galliscardovia ingluviei TaxID=1769422 RepID=A0A8J3AS56_9BIFI|nr:hypothetical protein GCM10007377_14780 [Galliscardovia ingluviei]
MDFFKYASLFKSMGNAVIGDMNCTLPIELKKKSNSKIGNAVQDISASLYSVDVPNRLVFVGN